MGQKAIIFLLPLLFLTPCWGKESRAILEKERALKEIRRKIHEKRRAEREKRKEERSILASLDKVEREIERCKKELRSLEEERQRISAEIRRAQRELARIERERERLKEVIRRRLEGIYGAYRYGAARLILSSSTYGDMVRRWRVLNLLLQEDAGLLRRYGELAKQKDREWQRLRERQRLLLDKEREIEEKERALEKEKRRKREILLAIKAEREKYQQAISELRKRERALKRLIEELREKGRGIRRKGKGFVSMKGRLPLPVKGRIFRLRGRRKGIGFRAKEGAEIRAVYDGTVVYASWFMGYGNLMIIDHGDGYHTLFAHASRLLKKVGERVKAGEVVALVGNTGSFEGPMLYFEIRHKGRCENPLVWLALPRERRRR